ncbi:conserved hypothetical protein [Culex quinquefasciatus]|uniref:Transposable element P transposase-like RNase H domain-containing protein n=1 Tax=Culex quinquefasciatus TaxID=7176 RepID=B0XFA6_CULQU|nr:conserved hypothetical protein [Culex quinquefasciatus]|eukprot:XP_001868328.1 conserved hypothetical protein [Culex quinquefasciatus]
MPINERVVTILIDAISIKPILTYQPDSDTFYGLPDNYSNAQELIFAKEAVTVMVRSLSSNFKQAKQEAYETLTAQQRYPPCFNGVISNINALKLIWDRLETIGFQYLLTRKLNQDPLENAFAGSRRSCGSNDCPSAREFGISVKYYSARRTIDCISGANCEVDEEDQHTEDKQSSPVPLLQENEDRTFGTIFLSENSKDDSMSCSQFEPDPLETPCDYVNFPFKSLDPDTELPNLPTLNGLNYILGYAASKLKHKKCKRKLCLKHKSEGLQEDDYLFCRLKHYLNARGFNYPNKKAVEIGLTLIMAFEQQFFEFINTSRFGVKKRLKEYISREIIKMWLVPSAWNDILTAYSTLSSLDRQPK